MYSDYDNYPKYHQDSKLDRLFNDRSRPMKDPIPFLFSGPSIQDLIAKEESKVFSNLHALSKEKIRNGTLLDLIRECVVLIPAVDILWNERVESPSLHVMEPSSISTYHQRRSTINVHVVVPVSGNRSLLTHSSGGYANTSLVSRTIKVCGEGIEFTWSGAVKSTSDEYQNWLDGMRTKLQQALDTIMQPVNTYNQKIMETTQNHISSLIQESDAIAAFAKDLARKLEQHRENS